MSASVFFPVGNMIGDYEVVTGFSISGGGGEHAIGESRDGTRYHLKTPSSPRDTGGESRVLFDAFVDRWESKIQSLNTLGSLGSDIIVPNEIVVETIDVSGTNVRYAFIVSPFTEDMLDIKRLDLSDDERIAYMVDAAQQLMRLHQAGFVHADIKMPNVMPYRRDGRVGAKLLDFDGSYKLGDPPEEHVMDFHHAAPEVVAYANRKLAASELDAALDIFSLGATFAQLWAGRMQPVDMETDVRIRYPGDLVLNYGDAVAQRYFDDWLSGTDHGLDDAVKQMILQMMRYKPDDRPGLREVIKFLRNPEKGFGSAVSEAPSPESATAHSEPAETTKAVEKPAPVKPAKLSMSGFGGSSVTSSDTAEKPPTSTETSKAGESASSAARKPIPKMVMRGFGDDEAEAADETETGSAAPASAGKSASTEEVSKAGAGKAGKVASSAAKKPIPKMVMRGFGDDEPERKDEEESS